MNDKARVIILDLNKLAPSVASHPAAGSASSRCEGIKRLDADSLEEVSESDSDTDDGLAPTSNPRVSELGQDSNGDMDDLTFITLPVTIKDQINTAEAEEGDGCTWRLLPGTKNLKVNAMVVLPDGRLVGASSDGLIRMWDFSTKSR